MVGRLTTLGKESPRQRVLRVERVCLDQERVIHHTDKLKQELTVHRIEGV